MYSKYPFPLSMENIPRQRGFCCASLKITTIITALLVILYSLYGVAQGVEILQTLFMEKNNKEPEALTTAIVVAQIITHIITFLLSVLLLLGALRRNLRLIRAWLIWSAIQVTVSVMVYIYITALSTISSFIEPAELLFYVAHFFKLLVQMYMVVLVNTYYRQLEEGHGETERLKDPEDFYTVPLSCSL